MCGRGRKTQGPGREFSQGSGWRLDSGGGLDGGGGGGGVRDGEAAQAGAGVRESAGVGARVGACRGGGEKRGSEEGTLDKESKHLGSWSCAGRLRDQDLIPLAASSSRARGRAGGTRGPAHGRRRERLHQFRRGPWGRWSSDVGVPQNDLGALSTVGGGSGAQGPHLKIQMPPGPAFGAADLGNPNVTSGVSPDPLRLGESEAQPKGAPPTRPTIPCGDSQQGGRHFHASPAHLVSALAQRRDLLRTC